MCFLFQYRNVLTRQGSSVSPLLFKHGRLTARRVFLQDSRSSVHRTFASIAPPPLVEDVVEVPVGGAGSITLTILRPLTDNAQANPKVILYLPRGPIFQNESVVGVKDHRTLDYSSHDDDHDTMISSSLLRGSLSTPQELMAAITGANVVTVNYRLGYTDTNTKLSNSDNGRIRPFYRYPTPVHDTLAGLDWVLQTLRPGLLFVFGSNIGGSLATMLSLTESQHIHVVAAHEPVCDWTGLDDYCTIDPQIFTGSGHTIGGNKLVIVAEGDEMQKSSAQPTQTKQPSKHRRKAAPSDLVPLLNTRRYLFDSPSKYFDPFASPMLFLRSAGKDVPKVIPEYFTGTEYPIPLLKTPIDEEELIDLWDIHIHTEDEPRVSENENATPVEVEERPSRRRKALSRWPPYGLDTGNDGGGRGFTKSTRLQINLPWMKFFARLGSNKDVPMPFQSLESVTNSNENDGPSPKHRTSRRSATENNSVLATQAKDMVSVMRRACFWGEDAGNGEERVTLRNVTRTTTADHNEQLQLTDPNYLETVHESANWFKEMMYKSRYP
ncbi:conserved hypothetical protein [Talaromyces stipitatus ATCC 10500]|uniref:Alpha/beta hydrolase fold-3 domain-containing protein n=1 Tax=Talaromyces stipitatus (strain ATCC 10500 / CBS 375.48 / QM 6759 / NRRL 1006) TaxID=441959 RepID=B8M363_TALSN|nr:uncharacterized protein TSTA_092850 [Talaromyces stipitatus ATCC 10500]EED22039.1 conserved hypothetical protein [Talaromyces stipitatus ATCC 10500]